MVAAAMLSKAWPEQGVRPELASYLRGVVYVSVHHKMSCSCMSMDGR